MKKRRAPRHTPRYDVLVETCRRLNRIADEKAERAVIEANSQAARRARVEAEERKLLAEIAERDKNNRNPPK